MAPGIFDEWRAERQLRRSATAFVAELCEEPDEADVEWLGRHATGGDLDRARWELRYARRAIGLLLAQQAALDDRTAAAVAHEVAESLASDPNVAAGRARLAERQFNERLRGYGESFGRRGIAEPTATRLGRGLLIASGAGLTGDALLPRAAELAGRYASQAAEAVRRIFGTAELREDIPPSAQVAPRR